MLMVDKDYVTVGYTKMHFYGSGKTAIVLVKAQFVYYNVIGFIRKSHCACALNQNLLSTLSNPLSMKQNFAGGDQKIVQNENILHVCYYAYYAFF